MGGEGEKLIKGNADTTIEIKNKSKCWGKWKKQLQDNALILGK